jgi:hypothetical protein
MPGNLREQALAQRRQSTTSLAVPSTPSASEFGSIGMATEQATRMLKVYRKKLVASKEDLSFGELEGELEQLLKLVKEKKGQADGSASGGTAPKTPRGTLRRMKSKQAIAKAGVDNDVDDLAALMDRTNLAERSPVGLKT